MHSGLWCWWRLVAGLAGVRASRKGIFISSLSGVIAFAAWSTGVQPGFGPAIVLTDEPLIACSTHEPETAMSHMIQIRNVPTSLHRALKARAALEGRSMSDLLLEQIEASLALPSEASSSKASALPLEGRKRTTAAGGGVAWLVK